MSDGVGVLVAEDDPATRDALAELVASDASLRLVDAAADGRSAVERSLRARPDVVVMDLRMPVLDGVAATRLIRARQPRTRVLVLTTFDEDDLVYDALAAGADGFLLKTASPDEILRGIHTVHAGQRVLAPRVTRWLVAKVVGGAAQASAATRLHTLTARERQVVAEVARGLSNEEIAGALRLSPATVKTYLSRLFVKLDVRDRTQLVILAYESGQLDRLT